MEALSAESNADQSNEDGSNEDQSNADQSNADQSNAYGSNADQSNEDQSNEDQSNEDEGLECAIDGPSDNFNYCYTLFNSWNDRTYVGYTNRPDRRIRQHNGELVGGARMTTREKQKAGVGSGFKWQYLARITGTSVFDKHVALSLEWHLKYSMRRDSRLRGPKGRIEAIAHALSNPKFECLLSHGNVVVSVVSKFQEAARLAIDRAGLATRVCLQAL
jgi:predicted GIY-YIG superfamily endonuclease